MSMTSSLFENARRWLGQNIIIKTFRSLGSSLRHPNYTIVNSEKPIRTHKSVIFLCPSENTPRGGVKVIYNQVAAINGMTGEVRASVLHPYDPDFYCSWFDHETVTKKDLAFDKSIDFVLIPEFWAVPHARIIHNIGVKYGIYVQGGYVMGLRGSYGGEEHEHAYHNAELILGISDDTVDSLKMAFPECAEKMLRIHYSVNADRFVPNSHKENIISYMPRRMKNHTQLVTYFLRKLMPPHWSIVSIDGLDENGVAATLARSKIFLSFSELEGLPLPPLEAALSGCQVIGYTGEGAKEYWNDELFTEIHSGDIKSFVKAISNMIRELDKANVVVNLSAIGKLADRYSAQVELADMQLLSRKVFEILELHKSS